VGTIDFEDVFKESFGVVVRTAYVVTGDWEVAREIGQDAFLQLLRHWRKVSRYDNPGAWARRVGIRLAVREAQRGRRAVADLSPDALDADAVLDLRRALLDLSPAQRAAVSMHYIADMPVVEVAEALECSESTVRTHLQRARTRLAELLAEEVGR
jgi:RNA polymerase sigma-70 factor (ECF subfamily)